MKNSARHESWRRTTTAVLCGIAFQDLVFTENASFSVMNCPRRAPRHTRTHAGIQKYKGYNGYKEYKGYKQQLQPQPHPQPHHHQRWRRPLAASTKVVAPMAGASPCRVGWVACWLVPVRAVPVGPHVDPCQSVPCWFNFVLALRGVLGTFLLHPWLCPLLQPLRGRSLSI